MVEKVEEIVKLVENLFENLDVKKVVVVVVFVCVRVKKVGYIVELLK